MAHSEKSGLMVNRIEALSDGVFAIAMTLLVLELRVPEVENADELLHALAALWPRFVSFGLGFVLLGSIWVGQHYQFHYVRRTNRTWVWLHLGLLLVCSLMPFTVAMLGRYWATPLVCALYGSLLLLSGTFLYLSWNYATSRHRLVDAGLPGTVVRALRARILVGMLGYGLGFGLSFLAPVASLVIYASMPLLYLIPSRIDAQVKVP